MFGADTPILNLLVNMMWSIAQAVRYKAMKGTCKCGRYVVYGRDSIYHVYKHVDAAPHFWYGLKFSIACLPCTLFFRRHGVFRTVHAEQLRLIQLESVPAIDDECNRRVL